MTCVRNEIRRLLQQILESRCRVPTVLRIGNCTPWAFHPCKACWRTRDAQFALLGLRKSVWSCPENSSSQIVKSSFSRSYLYMIGLVTSLLLRSEPVAFLPSPSLVLLFYFIMSSSHRQKLAITRKCLHP